MTQFEADPVAVEILPPVPAGAQITSMSLLASRLYVGLTRSVNDPLADSPCLFSYEIETGRYQEVAGSEPGVQNDAGYIINWMTGCHAMVEFSREADDSACLYASILTQSGSSLVKIRQGKVVKTLPLIDKDILIHSLAVCNGRVFAAGYNADRALVIYSCKDPDAGDWQLSCEPGFNDTGNMSVTSMAGFGNNLYITLLNPNSGFQLWRTSTEGATPYTWHQVISQGALRYTLNPAVMSMAAFNGALYLGTGPYGALAQCNTGNCPAAELIQVFPDDSWEIVAGSPRFSPYGLKVPMAAMGPGFDDSTAYSINALSVKDGYLYAITANAASVDSPSISKIWRSADGEEWVQVPADVPDTMNAMFRDITITEDTMLVATAGPDYSDPINVAGIRAVKQRRGKEPGIMRLARSLLR